MISSSCQLVTVEQLSAEREIEKLVFAWVRGEISQEEAEEKSNSYVNSGVFSNRDKRGFLYRRDLINPRKITTFLRDIIISHYNEEQVIDDYRDYYEKKFGIKVEKEEIGTTSKGLIIANFKNRKNSPNQPDYRLWGENDFKNKFYCEAKCFRGIQRLKIDNLRMCNSSFSYLVVGIPSRLVVYLPSTIKYLLTQVDQFGKCYGKRCIEISENNSPINLQDLSKQRKVKVLENPNERKKL
ncbi:hypothetical protein LCGC14_1527200 [marine sediment metagenome]|uniref:Uncharacterized protein n=1 Tax=marine sediment metagenome TaxID=412755 RepID=A0A0F9IWU6_9ZZZZ